jgi:hypothetical protein
MKQSLEYIKTIIQSSLVPNTKLKNLRYLSKLHMQYCAILSQQNNHVDALKHAKYGTKYSHDFIKETLKIAQRCELGDSNVAPAYNNARSNTIKKTSNDSSFLGDLSVSIIAPFGEHAQLINIIGRKLVPIIQELLNRCVNESLINDGVKGHHKSQSGQPNAPKKQKVQRPIDIRNLFGFLQSSEWIASLNIGNIMQMTPITLQDLLSSYNNDIELSREALLEKIALLSVSYFCISTEKRFLAQEAPSGNQRIAKESEFWHAKALEIACCFLPAECPLVNHIFTSYQKHHSPIQQAIVNSNIL